MITFGRVLFACKLQILIVVGNLGHRIIRERERERGSRKARSQYIYSENTLENTIAHFIDTEVCHFHSWCIEVTIKLTEVQGRASLFLPAQVRVIVSAPMS